MDEIRSVTVEAVGVVDINYDKIEVNSRDLIAELREKLEAIPYERSYSGCFAGRIKLEVELLGEMAKKTEEGR